MGRRILLIDNYDSFVYNLAQYFGELGADPVVVRNDAIAVEDIDAMAPAGVVISPGPGRPAQAGISVEVIKRLGEVTSILGVCLGHQAIAEAYGGKIISASEIMHGKTSLVYHKNVGVLESLPQPFEATRYHSLIVEKESLPDELEITGETSDGVIMAFRHRQFPVTGVQFHPESVLTVNGKSILENFLASL